LRDAKGRVIGVRVDRDGGKVMADVVVLAEGVNGLIGQRAGLRETPKPDQVALAVKEMHFLPSDVIESRFNIKGDEGVVIEAVGTISKGMTGMGFIYTNKESISVGIGCLISDFAKTGASPAKLLEDFKAHPVVAPLIAGSEVKEYAAHMIPEGGYKAIPQLYGDGWVVVGDAAQFNNAVHREGSNLAMTTGRLAAEAIFQIKSRRDPMTKENLALYKKLVDDSFVMRDLKKYKDMPALLHTNAGNFFKTYPELVSKAMEQFLRVDGRPKVEKEKETFKAFRAARGLRGLVGDVVRLARAWN
jgi:electron transfer flavoprotein-quinone oxidoreductase